MSKYARTVSTGSIRPRFLRFETKEQVLFARRLSTYLSAGVPILEALTLLAEDARTTGARHILHALMQGIAEGHPLSTVLRTFPQQVRLFVVSMIEVGEQGGTLRESLAYLAQTLRKQEALKRKLVGALVYPAIIVVMTIVICSFLILYAFPKIVPLFRGFGSELPLPTRILIFVSDAVSQYGFIFLGILVIVALMLAFLIRRPSTGLWIDSFLLRVPVFGSLIRSYYLASVSRVLATLLRSGVGIVPALDLASFTAANRAYAHHILNARNHVLAGERIAYAFTGDERCFPKMYAQMVGTGERTGSLPGAFDTLAEHYEEEFDTASEGLATLIEPVLMIIMGLLVGFIALAIITPVYQITQDLHL